MVDVAHLVGQRPVPVDEYRPLWRAQRTPLHHTPLEFRADTVIAIGRANILDVFRTVIAKEFAPSREHCGKQIFAEVQANGFVFPRTQRLFVNHIQPGIHPVLKKFVRRMWPPMKSPNPTTRIRFDQIRIERVIVRMQQQRRISAALLVSFPNSRKVDVHHRVAIEHDELFRKRVEPGQNRPRRAERLLLDYVFDGNAPTNSSSKMGFNFLRLIKGKNQNVTKAVPPCQLDLMLQERLAPDRDHRLGQIAQPRLQPRAQTTRQNDQLLCVAAIHFPASRFSRMARLTASSDVIFGDQPSFWIFAIE